MRALCVLLLVLKVIDATSESEKIFIYKCCDVFQMLSGDGESCVDTIWPRNETWYRLYGGGGGGVVDSPLNARWVSRWLPPGLSLDRVLAVHFGVREWLFRRSFIRAVEASGEWDERQPEAEGADRWSSNRVVFRSGGVFQRGHYFSDIYHKVVDRRHYGLADGYCVDAAKPPLAPFVLLVNPNCDVHDCVHKCCAPWRMMANRSESWVCNVGMYMPPDISSFVRQRLPETPFDDREYYFQATKCDSTGSLRLAPWDAKMTQLLRRRFLHFFFSSWDTCVDFLQSEDGALVETLFYCQESQISRGIYWLLRLLCFVSTSLLIIALLSITTNNRMRRKAHGWCLTCHATCLLGFNLGQVAYYMSFSDEIDTLGYVPEYFLSTCIKFALPMYFLLNAANCWLTALCLNMVLGFRKLQMARLGVGGDRKRFYVLSAMAWGLPALMTGLCAYAFNHDPNSRKWYSPTLVETRTCFNELRGITSYVGRRDGGRIFNIHWYPGTALFYYGPTAALILVNAICITFTLRKVQFLRQGNSILHRQGSCVSPKQRQGEEENPHSATTSISNEAHTTVVDAKTIKLFMKMFLMIGAVEMGAESIGWATGNFGKENIGDNYQFAYRATGYAADCFRAVCVAWLAAPEEGYFGTLRRRLGGGERGWGRRWGRG